MQLLFLLYDFVCIFICSSFREVINFLVYKRVYFLTDSEQLISNYTCKKRFVVFFIFYMISLCWCFCFVFMF